MLILSYLACAIVTIHLFENNGEIHNECVVELETDVDVEDAKDKSGQYLGDKTIDGNSIEY